MPAGKLPGLTLAKGGKVAIFNREQTRYDSKSEVVINDELRNICKKLNDLI
jgi:NAD-dependent SIR2 family protein deacetylase